METDEKIILLRNDVLCCNESRLSIVLYSK